MVVALLADVHANLEALRSCLAHAEEWGARRFAFLGDLVGYGAEPDAVVEIVSTHVRKGTGVAVKGNHDEAIAADGGYFNESAAEALAWTRSVIAPPHREFLSALPLVVRDEQVTYVHASAAAPADWDYIDSPAAARRSARAAGTAYTFSGHVHRQALYGEDAHGRMVEFQPRPGVPIPMSARRAWLAIVGSVGQPRDGDPAAAYAIADLGARTITFHRVPYDHRESARKIRAAGLPELLAYRLERGA